MAKFILPVIDQFRSELSYLPAGRRREAVERLERLLSEIDAGRTYTFGALHKLITQYAPAENATLPLKGSELLHDLGYVLEHLSGTFHVDASEAGEAVLRLEQVTDMLDVPPFELRQWRHEGLIVKRYVFGDEKQSGVCESELVRFLEARSRAASRSSHLRLPDAGTKRRLWVRCERTMRPRRPALCRLTDELSARYHLPREAVLLALRERDLAHPNDMLHPDLVYPLTPEQKWEIHESRLAGESLASLMERFDRDRITTLRIIRQVKATQILQTVEGYIGNPLYDHPRAEELILGWKGPGQPPREAVVPSFVEEMGRNDLLTAQQELDLFRRYNFLKHRIAQLYGSTPPSLITGAVVQRIRSLRDVAVTLRNVIIERNLRLVLRVAHRHAGRLAAQGNGADVHFRQLAPERIDQHGESQAAQVPVRRPGPSP